MNPIITELLRACHALVRIGSAFAPQRQRRPSTAPAVRGIPTPEGKQRALDCPSGHECCDAVDAGPSPSAPVRPPQPGTEFDRPVGWILEDPLHGFRRFAGRQHAIAVRVPVPKHAPGAGRPGSPARSWRSTAMPHRFRRRRLRRHAAPGRCPCGRFAGRSKRAVHGFQGRGNQAIGSISITGGAAARAWQTRQPLPADRPSHPSVVSMHFCSPESVRSIAPVANPRAVTFLWGSRPCAP